MSDSICNCIVKIILSINNVNQQHLRPLSVHNSISLTIESTTVLSVSFCVLSPALVTSLVLCPVSGLLLSSSLDGTLRCWRPEVGDQVQIISIPNGCPPPLVMGGPDSAGTFFSYSTNSVDFWTFNCLYNLHCRLDGFLRGPVHQILTPPTPPCFRACVVCIHGNSDVTVVAAETGEVLTRFQANGRVRCADYCVPKEILLVLTEDGVVTIASTLTSPVTILDEWHGIEHWDWSGGQMQANIGIVCCMVLYNDVKDIQIGQEEWRSLQMQRSQKPKKIKLLHDAKNRLVFVAEVLFLYIYYFLFFFNFK